MRSRFVAIMALIIFAGHLSGQPLHAAAPDPAKLFIRNGIDRVLDILKMRDIDRAEKLRLLRAAFTRYFDHKFIARYAAGQHYRQAPRATQIAYVDVLEDFLVHAYGSRMLLYSTEIDLKLKATDIFAITKVTEPRPGYFVVHTHINRAVAELIRINWHVRKKSDTYKVVDVVIMGMSQARRYRSDFSAAIVQRRRGLSGLVQALRAKVVAYQREAERRSAE